MENQDLNSKSLTEENKDISAVQRIIENILDYEELLENQREDLKRFNRYLEANSKLTNTRRNYLTPLKFLAIFIKKPFKEATRSDIEDYIVSLKGHKKSTISLQQATIKQFYRWLYDMKRGQYPEQVDWIKIEKPKKMNMPVFLTESEIRKMISVCDSIRDKCILSVLFESGCRIGEIIPLNTSDIEFDKKYPLARFNVKSVEGCKTGSRNIPIPLVNSVPIVNNHRLKSVAFNKQCIH